MIVPVPGFAVVVEFPGTSKKGEADVEIDVDFEGDPDSVVAIVDVTLLSTVVIGVVVLELLEILISLLAKAR